jgi:prepilin-type N-terminal cleavage/methylation domain-containing protein
MGKLVEQQGFSLVEMALVIFIVSLLLGGLLGPLSTQIDRQRVSETEDTLQTARDALLGFAAANGYLPCPTNDIDPSSSTYGVALDGACGAEGFLPWATLGISPVDAWGTPVRIAIGDPTNGFIRYRVDTAFDQAPLPPVFSLSTAPNDAFTVADANDNALTITGVGPDRPIAIIYSTGPDITANKNNVSAAADYTGGPRMENCAAGCPFDDITIWISRPEFFNQMIKAGQLP